MSARLTGSALATAVALFVLAAPAAAQQTPQKPPGMNSIDAIGCFGGNCVGDGGNQLLPITSGTLGSVQQVQHVTFFWDAACGSPTYCLAVGDDENDNDFPGGNGFQVGVAVPVVNGAAQSTINNSPMIIDQGVVCPGPTTCVAVGEYQPSGPSDQNTPTGAVVKFENGQPGQVQVADGSVLILKAACMTADRCLATAEGVGNPIPSGFVQINDGVPGAFQPVNYNEGINGIACPTSTRCIAAAGEGDFVLDNGAVTKFNSAPNLGLISMTCADASHCYAADPNSGFVYAVAGDGSIGHSVYFNSSSIEVACATSTSCFVGGHINTGDTTAQALLYSFSPASFEQMAAQQNGSGGGGSSTVGAKPTKCVVPNVVGDKLKTAKHALKAAGCRVGKIKHRSSKRSKRGRVLAESPHAGKHRKLGTKVNLTLGR
jgi:hypothetical protein